MKNKILKTALFFSAIIYFFASVTPTHAGDESLFNRLRGRIVLQVQENGEAWYINPSDKKRHYMGRPHDAFELMRNLGVGAKNSDLEKIPKSTDQWTASFEALRYTRGKILIQVEQHGEAWYVNPVDGRRYYLGRPQDAFNIMRSLGLGITTSDLRRIDFGSGPLEKNILPVPFSSQAPTRNWNLPFAEACEETVIMMIDYYYRGKTEMPKQEIVDKIYYLVNWQNDRFGFYDDTSMADTAIIAKETMGYDSILEKEVSKEKIIEYINKGMPVVLPVAGRELGNPYFKHPGPPYHVILIVGWENDEFITHEPGTGSGGFWRYNQDHLVRINHDLTVDQHDIKNGERGMLILKRKE